MLSGVFDERTICAQVWWLKYFFVTYSLSVKIAKAFSLCFLVVIYDHAIMRLAWMVDHWHKFEIPFTRQLSIWGPTLKTMECQLSNKLYNLENGNFCELLFYSESTGFLITAARHCDVGSTFEIDLLWTNAFFPFRCLESESIWLYVFVQKCCSFAITFNSLETKNECE